MPRRDQARKTCRIRSHGSDTAWKSLAPINPYAHAACSYGMRSHSSDFRIQSEDRQGVVRSHSSDLHHGPNEVACQAMARPSKRPMRNREEAVPLGAPTSPSLGPRPSHLQCLCSGPGVISSRTARRDCGEGEWREPNCDDVAEPLQGYTTSWRLQVGASIAPTSTDRCMR